MSYERPTSSFNCRAFRKKLKQIFNVFLVFILLVQMLPMQALAAWDGSGDSSAGSTVTVSGNYKLYFDANNMLKNILGYRFSIYDSEGNKLGNNVDLDCNRGCGAV